MDVERMCEWDICGGPRFIEGPSLGNCFWGFSGSETLYLSGEFIPSPAFEPASKKEGGSSRSFHDFGFVDFCALVPPLPLAAASGLLWMTANKASSCLIALGSSITDVLLSSPPATDPSAPFSLIATANIYRSRQYLDVSLGIRNLVEYRW